MGTNINLLRLGVVIVVWYRD